MALNVRIDLSVIAALVAGQIVSYLWYSDILPWLRHEERYWMTSLAADFALAILIQYITRNHLGVRSWQNAVSLGVCAALFYAVLTAPHNVYGPNSIIILAFNTLHKFVVVTAMTLAMFFVRKSGY